MKKSALALAALLLFAPVPVVSAQNITLRYGQIPSTIKTVSALHFYIAQRKGFFRAKESPSKCCRSRAAPRIW